MIDYNLIDLNKDFISSGLADYFGKEFSISKGKYNESDVRIVLDNIIEHFVSTQQKINNTETFGCGSWLIQFKSNDTYIELHELKDVLDGENLYDYDLSICISFIKEQIKVCKDQHVEPMIPLIGQKIAVSQEIYSGSEVNAVRYEAPEHMSGWYLTSNSYNGDVNSLIVDHLYHLLKSRPDLAKYLALPNGFRFFKDSEGLEIWKDEEIA